MKGFARLVETRIQAAQAEGQLDRLKGEGKPLPPDDLSGLTEEERADALLTRVSGGAEGQARMLKELESLRAEAAAAADPEERRFLLEEARKLAVRLSIVFEQAGKPLASRRVIEE